MRRIGGGRERRRLSGIGYIGIVDDGHRRRGWELSLLLLLSLVLGFWGWLIEGIDCNNHHTHHEDIYERIHHERIHHERIHTRGYTHKRIGHTRGLVIHTRSSFL